MKNKIWFGVNILLSLAVVFFAFSEHGSAQKRDMWEYKVQFISLNPIDRPEAALNKLGEDGWELYVINDVPNLGSGYIFKRKK